MTPHRTITTDLPCLQCGYNLRTRPTHQNCPECNYPIVLTLWGGLPLTDTRARRLCLAIASAALALALCWFTQLTGSDAGYNSVHRVWFIDPVWIYTPPAVLLAVAMLLFAMPQTSPNGTPLFRGSRRLILATVPAAPLALLLWERAYAWVPADRFEANRRLLCVPLLLVAPGILCSFRLLARLVRPLGQRRFRLPLRAVTAGWWAITLFATLALCAQIPFVKIGFETHWFPAFHLPHVIEEPLEAVMAGVGFAAAFLFLLGIALLICLPLPLAFGRPRCEPTFDSPIPAELSTTSLAASPAP
jgi:hypothetical protein